MRDLPNTLFLLQYAATLIMTGLIWFVQIVHYPLFTTVYRQTGPSAFRAFEAQHASRTGWVVFPPMVVELLSSVAALWPIFRPKFASAPEAAVSTIMVLSIWASTGLIQVPLHNRLANEPMETVIRRLIFSNWLRTALWTARTVLLSLCWLREIR